jgi:iron(III) transport system permease protein
VDAALATLGYAFPGAVLAVGLFIPVAALDNWLINTGRAWFGFDGRDPQGHAAGDAAGLPGRFLAVGFGPIDSAPIASPATSTKPRAISAPARPVS